MPTLQSDGQAFMLPTAPDDAALMGIAPGSPALHVHISGRSFGRLPISFQIMVVPPTRYGMRLDFNPPGGA